MSATSFVVDTSRVASETLEGETIIINFQTGTYYSLNETATEIWKCILAGYTVAAIEQHLSTRYEVHLADSAAALSTFLLRLQEEHLIEAGAPVTTTPLPVATQPKSAFIAPEMKAFRDMQEMLLADPIHDIDASGWPNLKKE